MMFPGLMRRLTACGPQIVLTETGSIISFFHLKQKAGNVKRGLGIGVAISEKPYGPFIPETER